MLRVTTRSPPTPLPFVGPTLPKKYAHMLSCLCRVRRERHIQVTAAELFSNKGWRLCASNVVQDQPCPPAHSLSCQSSVSFMCAMNPYQSLQLAMHDVEVEFNMQGVHGNLLLSAIC
jgi:hypothetical protein